MNHINTEVQNTVYIVHKYFFIKDQLNLILDKITVVVVYHVYMYYVFRLEQQTYFERFLDVSYKFYFSKKSSALRIFSIIEQIMKFIRCLRFFTYGTVSTISFHL